VTAVTPEVASFSATPLATTPLFLGWLDAAAAAPPSSVTWIEGVFGGSFLEPPSGGMRKYMSAIVSISDETVETTDTDDMNPLRASTAGMAASITVCSSDWGVGGFFFVGVSLALVASSGFGSASVFIFADLFSSAGFFVFADLGLSVGFFFSAALVLSLLLGFFLLFSLPRLSPVAPLAETVGRSPRAAVPANERLTNCDAIAGGGPKVVPVTHGAVDTIVITMMVIAAHPRRGIVCLGGFSERLVAVRRRNRRLCLPFV